MSEEREGADAPDDGYELDDQFAEPDEAGGEEVIEDGAEDAPSEQIQERPPTRSHPGRRERQAARELRELRERVERQERDLQQARQYQQPRLDPYEAQRREQAWRDQVALLPPDQAAAAWAERTRNEVNQALVSHQSTLADQMDRTSWEAACRGDPVRARLSNQVEQLLAGMPPSQVRNRETVFTYLYGQEALKQRTSQTARQRQAAQRRVAAQTTSPGATRSDGVRQRGQPGDTSGMSTDERWNRLRNSGRPLW